MHCVLHPFRRHRAAAGGAAALHGEAAGPAKAGVAHAREGTGAVRDPVQCAAGSVGSAPKGCGAILQASLYLLPGSPGRVVLEGDAPLLQTVADTIGSFPLFCLAKMGANVDKEVDEGLGFAGVRLAGFA